MRIHSVLRKNSNLIATVLRSRGHIGITRTVGSNNGACLRRLISFSNTRTQPVYQEQRLLYETELPHLSSWNDKTSLKDEASRKEIVRELTMQQSQTIESVVSWFHENMPSCYFRSVGEQFRMDHIKALSAIQDANLDLHMNLKTHLPDGRLILTYIRPGKENGRLLSLTEDLPWTHDNPEEYLPLLRAQVFTSKDEELSLSMFVYGETEAAPDSIENIGTHITEFARDLQDGYFLDDKSVCQPSKLFESEKLLEYFDKCSESYIVRSNPRRFLRQRELYEQVSGTEGMAVSIDEAQMDDAVGEYWIDVAVANSLPQIALENASKVLHQHNLDIVRSHLDVISDDSNGTVCMLRLLVTAPNNQEIFTSEEQQKLLIHELKRTKWLDPKTMNLVFERFPWLGVTRAEVITAFCSLLHPIKAPLNPNQYSIGNIFEALTGDRYIELTAAIADLFLDRFNPACPLDDDIFFDKITELSSRICNDVEDSSTQELLLKMIDIVSHTLRSNVYLEDRYALGLRLDPKIMKNNEENESRENPYGIIFTHGRRFNAFHVRFRDIARGGLRLVTPSSPEQHVLESARQYKECYDLAFAQQLKNKDIPEGGSKAVNLINCSDLSEQAKAFVMRKSVKAFANTILDLIVDTEETRTNTVDYLGKKEVLYLGPDEQVTVEDINWIVSRAGKRGYQTPNAFMSSKPLTGINHKEFGVTSEGVNTYLDAALRSILGINPEKDEFTVKMTGGPDGDVAGNEIKILLREYGENAKIVGISDASGCAEDPEGLDHEELLRLVHESKSISEFDANRLGDDGTIHLVNTENGIRARNSMHNRLQADAFIPAGGRPSTIDIHNYRNFLVDGKPSSKLIVEGANLFVTGEAREALFQEAGVMIVKDSSANKCGVITSSYEICAAMLLSDDEFYANKEQIVNEILVKLRTLANMEAKLLFREFDSYKGSLPFMSQVISDAINTVTDTLTETLNDLSQEEITDLLPLFRDHLPKTLADLAFHRVNENVPDQYIKNAIASCMASKIVYKEGTKFVNSLPDEKLGELGIKYIQKEKEIALLKSALESTKMRDEEKDRILRLLEEGGVRTALMLDK